MPDSFVFQAEAGRKNGGGCGEVGAVGTQTGAPQKEALIPIKLHVSS